MLLYASFVGLVTIAALSDALRYRIPNWLTGGLALLFVLVALVQWGRIDWSGHLLAGGLAFAFGFALFLAGGMGAGDAKLIAVTALWLGLELVAAHVLLTALAGLALAAVVLPLRWLRLRLAAGRTGTLAAGVLQRGAPLPYGVAIATSAALLAAQAPAALWAF